MGFIFKMFGWLLVLIGALVLGGGAFVYFTREPQAMYYVNHVIDFGSLTEDEQQRANALLDALLNMSDGERECFSKVMELTDEECLTASELHGAFAELSDKERQRFHSAAAFLPEGRSRTAKLLGAVAGMKSDEFERFSKAFAMAPEDMKDFIIKATVDAKSGGGG